MKVPLGLLCFSLGVVVAGGCAPQLGDGCSEALDCAADGTRVCDTTQPGGYCLISGCRADECPDEGVCVRFGEEERARTFCMRHCEEDDDCRGDYDCAEPDPEASEPGEVTTAIVDEAPKGSRFCIETPPDL